MGLVLAIEAADAGSRVLLVDAGDEESWKHDIEDAPGQRTHIIDDERHAPLVLTTRRGLGGTSAMWGGRCVAFEPIDFEPRDYVPGSDWPIRIEDVQRWYEPTARHLDAGKAMFRSDLPDLPGLSEFTMSNLERWAQQPKLAPGLGRRVAEHPLVDTLFDARLTDIDFGDDGAVEGLVVRQAAATVRISASSYALAMGGLEITRLLLSIQRRQPARFGGADGPLGRYYMGHTTGSIADIVLEDPADVAELDFVQDETGTYTRRRFTLAEAAQRSHRVLNTSFYVDNPPFYEYEHRNATLSAVFLGLAIRPIGRLILAEGIRQRHVGPRPYHVGKHIGNIVRRPFRAAADVIDIIRRRYASRVRKPGFILRNEGGRYAIHYHGEQLPNPESRLTLSIDANGDEVLDVDYRFLEEDVDSLLTCHDLLDAELRAAGIGRIEYLGEDAGAVRRFAWEQTTDGFHSIGTTRMSREPGDGVVDSDLRVHGTSNLYIASSSVFPTSAEANPTFFAAVLAARLAHHLSGHQGVA
ncbi:GMC family oxidoreductase [Microbacterium sp. NPDC057741]|uniref:GMC family oxidoreductase n=1 Tax=Microbacterium sp. NPDC057741 TaxID=3346235 RepID=UPI0036707654